MTHASLFSGIGAPDLASEWMGWTNVFHCEINPFGQKILKYYWPNSISYEDIKKTDFTIHRGRIDVLTGGFPCQPYSVAGLRKGKEDERHLWPEMLRAIREIKPPWVVGENVRGLISWNGGVVFEEVQADLEAQGYEVQPYLLPAAGVNAPHKRDRVWFIAYAKGFRRSSGIREEVDDCGRETSEHITKRSCIRNRHQAVSGTGISTNANNNGLYVSKDRQGNNKGIDHNTAGKKSAIEPERCCSETTGEIFTNTTSEGLQITGQTRVEKLSKKNRKRMDNRLKFYSPTVTDSNSRIRRSVCRHEARKRRENAQYSVNSNLSCDEHAANITSSRGQQANWKRNTGFSNKSSEGDYWNNWPTQSPVCDGNDGLSTRLDSAALLDGRKPRGNWDPFGKWRTESIKAGGNAIVPQVIHQIFKAIEAYERL